ncbi:MAG: hypothetical protein B7733_14580 [Myxococcales bacterium FL481]|nr:MAG: hypothetical protein B7733_14580 [Myxococcales bacterium FL481]
MCPGPEEEERSESNGPLFEAEWQQEIERRRQTPDGEWIKGGIADDVLTKFLAKRRQKNTRSP